MFFLCSEIGDAMLTNGLDPSTGPETGETTTDEEEKGRGSVYSTETEVAAV